MENEQIEIGNETVCETKAEETAEVTAEETSEIATEETAEAVAEETADDTPVRKSNYPSQVVLTIRTIVGAYVMYLAYQIVTSGDEITPLIWACVALFIVAGAALVIMSVKHFILGEYEGGKKDTQ